MVTATKGLREQLKDLRERETGLRLEVITEVIDCSSNDDEVQGFFEDLARHGCISGMVGGLIYYADTVRFYDTYEDEIENLLEDTREQMGYKNRIEMIASLNGADNVGSIEQEKNLLSWFAFEETARTIAGELGLEI